MRQAGVLTDRGFRCNCDLFATTPPHETALPTLLNRRVFASGAAAGLLSACARKPPNASFVNVYSARHYEADRRLYDAFEQARGIAVRVLPANAEQLQERLRAEGDATEADLVVAADAGNLWRLQEAGLLQPATSSFAGSECAREPAQRHRPLVGIF